MMAVINELHRNFSSNQLSGTIPSEIGWLEKLQKLYVVVNPATALLQATFLRGTHK